MLPLTSETMDAYLRLHLTYTQTLVIAAHVISESFARPKARLSRALERPRDRQ